MGGGISSRHSDSNGGFLKLVPILMAIVKIVGFVACYCNGPYDKNILLGQLHEYIDVVLVRLAGIVLLQWSK